MSELLRLRGQWVLVTGASSGLGEAISRVLARDHGTNLVLSARRTERLEALAASLRGEHGVEAAVVPADLAQPGEAERLFVESTAGRTVHAAVLNAGVTWYGRHLDLPRETFEALLATNVASVVALATRFTRYLIERRAGGGLLLISSLGGTLPLPYQAAYGGTKAFLTHFGLDLREEVRTSGVTLTVFAPGGIATEMVETSGLSRRYPAGSRWLMPADRCARLAVQAFVRRKAFAVPGLANHLGLLLHRLLPRAVLTRLMARAYRPE
ncbi:MAG: SDR family NAD(P)-dependent oxidoreductase [Planctomycetes bacterium]|nr:SDR family NAD(P)-dependent oxidoreductase [Planctomycetota bacterium]